MATEARDNRFVGDGYGLPIALAQHHLGQRQPQTSLGGAEHGDERTEETGGKGAKARVQPKGTQRQTARAGQHG